MNENETIAAEDQDEQGSTHAGDVIPPKESGDASSHTEPTMSKNQLKKQRKREKWLVIKQERRFVFSRFINYELFYISLDLPLSSITKLV